jgi:hypothetical protein
MSTIPQTMGSLSVISTGFHSGVALTSRERVLHGMHGSDIRGGLRLWSRGRAACFSAKSPLWREPEQALVLLAFMRMDAWKRQLKNPARREHPDAKFRLPTCPQSLLEPA